jgi:hypothetical protein
LIDRILDPLFCAVGFIMGWMGWYLVEAAKPTVKQWWRRWRAPRRHE